jgi:cell division protein FtsB
VATERRKRASRVTAGGGRSSRSRRRLRLVWAVLVVGVVVYLYSQPLASYVETRRELAARQADVAALEATRLSLERRLAVSTSLEAAEREARRMGWVRPNERLFVVKGIPDWRKAHARRGEKS